jgi:hypothetical protein
VANIDLAWLMAAIDTGLQTGGDLCEHGLSRLNGFLVYDIRTHLAEARC